MKYFQLTAALLIVFVTLYDNAGAEPMVSGRTANQEFADTKVAMLVNAVCSGDHVAISAALQSGVDVEARGRLGETPLFWAVKCENLYGIESLLKAKANPNYRIPGQFTAVWAASEMYNPAPLKLLLRYGGDPNTDDGEDSARTALWNALVVGTSGHGWDNYYALLEAGADISRSTTAGETIVTEAIALGAFDRAEELLNRGYKGDLLDLSGSVSGRKTDDTAAPHIVAAKARIVKYLEEKKIPVPPVPGSVAGRVWMDSNHVLTVFWRHHREGTIVVKPWKQIIRPEDASYRNILARVHGIAPYQSRLILRDLTSTDGTH